MKRYDIEKLASCLCHSKVHVNVASTMTIDGSIFDRPQVGPAYDDTPNGISHQSSQELYLQEHFLPIAKSGGVEICRSREELIRAVKDGLEHPEKLAEGRRRLIREICTFNDGKATDRVARGVRAFLEQSVGVERFVGSAV
jgi:CDP-glycerol glycerophosphotransferase (TagB/SpsB family)